MAVAGFNGYGDLFSPDPRPLARRTDPETSHVAAREAVASGKVDSDRKLALGAVRTWPGSTVPELARHLAGPNEDVEAVRQRLGRRVSELLRLGLIERGAVRDGCHALHPRPGR